MRNKRITICVNETEKEEFKRLASEMGVSQSGLGRTLIKLQTFIKDAVKEAIKEVNFTGGIPPRPKEIVDIKQLKKPNNYQKTEDPQRSYFGKEVLPELKLALIQRRKIIEETTIEMKIEIPLQEISQEIPIELIIN